MLSTGLSFSTPALRVSTRIETYSCKEIKREKKLFRALESELIQDLGHSTSVSPPEHHEGIYNSAFGSLDQRSARKTLYLLIGLLNVAFPDHDFSKVRPEEFRREESTRAVLASLSNAVEHARSPESQRAFSSYPTSSSPTSDPPGLASSTPRSFEAAMMTNPFLQRVLDPVIDLADCEVFTYSPDIDSDPHAAESDDDSDTEEDTGAFEGDEDGEMAFQMDGIDGHGYASSSAGPSWQGGYGTPMKSFSPFLPPGTPTGSEDWSGEQERSSSGSLLWSSHHFLFNKKMKRILFISYASDWKSCGTVRDDRARLSLQHLGLVSQPIRAHCALRGPSLAPQAPGLRHFHHFARLARPREQEDARQLNASDGRFPFDSPSFGSAVYHQTSHTADSCTSPALGPGTLCPHSC